MKTTTKASRRPQGDHTINKNVKNIKKIKKKNYEIESIIVTAYDYASLAVKAMKAGAYDYILKPWNNELLIATINKVLQYKALSKEKRFLQKQFTKRHKFLNLIGSSPSMKEIFEIIEKVKNSGDTLIIQGESGTGKEQVAKSIHFSGNRKDKLFIPIECTSINPNVIESELFGHIKGAFTGAYKYKEGLLKSAGKGTIFLDEITEIQPYIQVKLLRALQEMEVKPVGSKKMERIEARIIVATNKDIYQSIKKGEFREDLFYRLNVVSIKVPPLRKHKEDIPPLVYHFIKKYSRDERELKGITSEALEIMIDYDWPGNIRQLENCIKRAFTLGSDELIDVKDLPEEILSMRSEKEERLKTIDEIEREYIIRTILHYNGSKVKAAKILGIGKSTLYNKLKEYSIDI